MSLANPIINKLEQLILEVPELERTDYKKLLELTKIVMENDFFKFKEKCDEYFNLFPELRRTPQVRFLTGALVAVAITRFENELNLAEDTLKN